MGIAARPGARRLMFRLCSSGRRAHDDPFPRPSLIFATALRLLFEPAPAASAPRRDSRRERGAHEGLPSEQNAHLRAGIEKETEAVPLVSPRHRPPAIPIAPLQACGGSGRPSTRRVVLTRPRLSTPLPARWLQPFSYWRHLMPNPTNPDKNQPVSPVKPAVPPVKTAPVQQPVKTAPAPFVPPAKTAPAQPHKP